MIPSNISPDHNGHHALQRSVARAACLNCRSAKRRCDGIAPICGPCSSRGISQGGCAYVTSKRGGPRYKGVKGAEAAKLKADKDKAKKMARTTKELFKSERDRERDVADGGQSSRSDASGSRTKIAPHHSSSSSSGNSNRRSGSPESSHSHRISTNSSFFTKGSASPDEGSNRHSYTPFSPFSTQPSIQSAVPPSGALPPLYYEGHQPVAQQLGPQPQFPQTHLPPPQVFPHAPHEHQQQMQQNLIHVQQPGWQVPHASMPHYPFQDPSFGGGVLSTANLEMWQRIQEGSRNEELLPFSDFYSRLEMLPKAGIVGGAVSCGDPSNLDLWLNWEEGDVGINIQDNEQSVRILLSDFYEHVYPSCPVLLPPGSLPSLAFYFSGKGPCGLFAAISAVVSLHLSPSDAAKTLKGTYSAGARTAMSSNDTSSCGPDELMATDEIAAKHAKSSETLLCRYAQQQDTCFVAPFDPSRNSSGVDEELICVEAAAAHTLLCHYYYGSGKPGSHQRAYRHALEAWKDIQALDLPSRCRHQPEDAFSSQVNATRPFTPDLKLEWAKRVYWTSYAAATVMSCTGGFQPFEQTRDYVLDLQMRPQLEHDVSAWGVMIRGAQQVSRAYRLLYELDQLRMELQDQGKGAQTDPDLIHKASNERQQIFNRMLKFDAETGTYTRFDPSWRENFTQEKQGSHVLNAEAELAKSLRIAGRLMSGGAMIILHRAQAFSNARVFTQPQCSIPEAAKIYSSAKRSHEAILHRANEDEDGDEGNEGKFEPASKEETYATAQNDPSHPLLVDKFSGGPFEPSHSLERCRFAASAMISTLDQILSDTKSGRAPKLPPYSACSYVIGAYATLMITLLVQVQIQQGYQSDKALSRPSHPNQLSAAASALQIQSVQEGEDLLKQLEAHRAPVRRMITVLHQFSNVWGKAVEYEEEVTMLLAANQSIR